MSRQYEYYIQQQLEPDQVLRGNAKQYREIVIGDRTFRIGEPPYNPLAHATPVHIPADTVAVEKAEDEFLKSKGII